MRINIDCDNDLAAKYQRSTKEYVDSEPTDTIDDIKIKLTLIFIGLTTDEFDLHLGSRGRKLQEREKILDLQKQTQNPLEFRLVKSTAKCCTVMWFLYWDNMKGDA